jgi:hypothetical protein
MKIKNLLRVFLFIISSAIIVSCESNGKKPETVPVQTSKEQYKCPMKCSEQVYDKPGKCPECGMELEKVIKG